jgi:hypothetical protein
VEATEIRTGGRYGLRIGGRADRRTVEVKVLGYWKPKGWLCFNVHSSRRLTVRHAHQFLYDIDLLEQVEEAKHRARAVVALAMKTKRPSVSR